MTKNEIKVTLAAHKEELLDFLADILDQEQVKAVTANGETIQERTVRLLQQMNMPRNLSGFQTIVEAIELLNQDPHMSFDQELYPKLAGERKSKSQIERLIRYAITQVLSQPGAENAARLLGYSSVDEVSTNRKFLLALLYAVR